MNSRILGGGWILVLAAAAAALVACGDPQEAQETGDSTASVTSEVIDANLLPWRVERVHRVAQLDAYLAANAADFHKFAYSPLGNSGVPVIMFRLFQDVFPDIWGAPGEGFGKVGLSNDPWVPGRTLPLGLGHAASTTMVPVPILGDRPIHVVQLTCMACHGGRIAGPDEVVNPLIGAPSTEFNQFRVAIARTVADPRYTADNFRAALAQKPLVGWMYGSDVGMLLQEQIERRAFNTAGAAETFLARLRDRAVNGAIRNAATLGRCTYAVTDAPERNGPKPGYLDAIGTGITLVADPSQLGDQICDVMPHAPAEIDPMSVWRQADRPFAQWDGSIVSAVHRQIASAFAIVGSAGAVDLDVAVRTTAFTRELPPAVYPFDVRHDAAVRGEQLYNAYCADCHAPGNSHLFTPAQIGTDGNRANIWTPFAKNALLPVLRGICSDPAACSAPDGAPLADAQILQPTGGYAAVPLAGIWARAPYLHNGSVPTLYHLLVPESRPTVFYRGNIHYDQDKVGFTWDQPATNVYPFDTRRAGASNFGHDTPEFLGGVDWASQPEMLADLLEYLKTL
jgi:mono/diheme cytochrome c family protein